MSYTKLAVRGAGVVFAFSVLGAGIGYLIRLILARDLSVEDFGLFYAVFSFLAFLSLIKTLGFDRALVKFIPEFLAEGDRRSVKGLILLTAGIQLVTNTIVIAAIYLSADFLAEHFFKAAGASLVLKLLAIGFFVDSFVIVLKYCFQGFKRMYTFALLDLVRMLLLLSLVVVGVSLGAGILGPTAAYLLTPIILLVIFLAVFLWRAFPGFLSAPTAIGGRMLRRVGKYSLYLMITSSGVLVLQHTDTLMLTYFAGVTSVALYNIALPTSKILTYFPLAIGTVLLPIASELWTKKKTSLVKEGIESLYKYSMIVMLPMALVLVSFAELALSIIFGREYAAAATALQILSVSTVFIALHQIHINFFSGIGRPDIHSKIIYSAVALNFLGNLILIPILGIIGAALTTGVSYVIMSLVGIWKMRSFVDIRIPWLVWLRIAVAGAGLLGAVVFLKAAISLGVWTEAAIVLSAGGLVYVALLFLLRIVSGRELLVLYRRVFGS